MNVTSQQIKDRLADIDWKLAGVDSFDELVDPLLDSGAAVAEFDARSRVLGAWSLANLVVFLLSVVSSNRLWGMSPALVALSAGTVVAVVRSYRARKTLRQRMETTYQVIDDLAHQFPRSSSPEEGQPAAT